MQYEHLFSTYQLGNITLSNRAVMAPMTRSRAIGNVPNELMAEYYGQRAAAGLIVTEGVAPSPNGLGYARIPGIYAKEQVEGWKAVADAIHAKGGRVFMQFMHTGRISHPLNMPEGAKVVAPSAVQAAGQMYTDQEGPLDHPVPAAMTAEEVESTIQEFVDSARNAIEAGFDGVEIHGANGYLVDQFLQANTNLRDDEFGGTPTARNRFALEIARRMADAIGPEKVGIRVSPYGAFNDIQADQDATHDQFVELAGELSKLGIAYIHIVDHASMGAPEVPQAIKAGIRDAFDGTLILSGGYDAQRAEADLVEGKGDLVAFGRPFLANPDLLERFKQGAELNAPDFDTFYTPGAEGYTDYPTL